jgi:hypothetical protein
MKRTVALFLVGLIAVAAGFAQDNWFDMNLCEVRAEYGEPVRADLDMDVYKMPVYTDLDTVRFYYFGWGEQELKGYSILTAGHVFKSLFSSIYQTYGDWDAGGSMATGYNWTLDGFSINVSYYDGITMLMVMREGPGM